MNVQKGKINHNPPLQTGPYQNQQGRSSTNYNLHSFDDASQKFGYGAASYVGASAGQVPSRLPLGSPLAGPNSSIAAQPSGPNSGGMPQGPPPYPSHGALDLSKQTPPIHQPAHHPLPPGALSGNQQISMANSGHSGPMQQGRSAQGNAQFFASRNQIRPGAHMQRPPMAGASMNPNHPPSTPTMAYPGNPSLGMTPPVLYYISGGDTFTNQQVYQPFQHPGYYPGGGNMHSGGAPFNTPRAAQPTYYRPSTQYQFPMQGSQGKTVYYPSTQQPQQQPQTPAPPAVASGAPPSQPRESAGTRPIEQKRKRQPIPIVNPDTHRDVMTGEEVHVEPVSITSAPATPLAPETESTTPATPAETAAAPPTVNAAVPLVATVATVATDVVAEPAAPIKEAEVVVEKLTETVEAIEKVEKTIKTAPVPADVAPAPVPAAVAPATAPAPVVVAPVAVAPAPVAVAPAPVAVAPAPVAVAPVAVAPVAVAPVAAAPVAAAPAAPAAPAPVAAAPVAPAALPTLPTAPVVAEIMVEQTPKPEEFEDSTAALPLSVEAAVDKELASVVQENGESLAPETPTTSSPTPVATSAGSDIDGRGTQKRKGRKNSRSGLTSTPTPPPQAGEEVQDEVPQKSAEPAAEEERRVDVSPSVPEVESVPKPVEKSDNVEPVEKFEQVKPVEVEKDVVEVETEVVPQVQDEIKSIPTADTSIETVITNGEQQAEVPSAVETESEATTTVVTEDAETPSSAKSSMLRYSYKDDQWSPLNPEGKKAYDRMFLLELQNTPASQKKPLGLPNLEVVRDKNSVTKRVDFAPLYLKIAPGKSNVTKRSSQQGSRGGDQGIGGQIQPPRREIKLMTSMARQERVEDPNVWKPKHASKIKDKDVSDEASTDELFKVVRGILNKLTPSKFNKLLETMKSLNIDTADRLDGVIGLFFEKAVDEPIFSSTYAKMCLELSSKEVASSTNPAETTTFRKLLLTRCQREFEKDSVGLLEAENKKKEMEAAETEEKKKELQEVLEDLVNKNRRRSLGNIRFIGELFKLRILSVKIMHQCITRLIGQTEDEESLEALCRLLSTIGKELENPVQQTVQSRTASNNPRDIMNGYFSSLDAIVNKRKTSNRIRFMIQDVMDLRKCQWKPRREDNNPKTIDQIHKDAIREREEQERELNNPNFNQSLGGSRDRPGDRRGDRNDRDRKGSRGGPSEDGWNTVNSSRNHPKIDLKQLRIPSTQAPSDTGMMLGPGGRGLSWARGASGGMTQSMSMTGPGPESRSNRYQILEDDSGAPASSDNKPPFSGRASLGGPPNRGNQDFRAPLSGPNKSAFYTKEGDRDRQMDGGRPPHSSFGRSRSQQSSRENSVTRSVRENPHQPISREISKELLLGKPNISDDEIERKVKSLLGEYFVNENIEEVSLDIKEWLHPSIVAKFINQCVMHVLESKSKDRKQTGTVFKELMKKRFIASKDIGEGFSEVLQCAEDFIVDIPKFWEYLAELVEPLFGEGGLNLAVLGPLTSSLQSQMAVNFIAAVFKELVKSKGDVTHVERMFNTANVQLDSILPKGVDVNRFLQDHNLEFLSKSDFKSNLEQYLRGSQCSTEEICNWIKQQTKGEITVAFIRALATAVTESAIDGNGTESKLNGPALKSRTEVLRKYVDNVAERELQFLFAVQSIVTQRQHPKGLIQGIFEILYDSNVVSEEGFETWVNIDEPSEREGKALSLKSITSFLTWLKEADPESDQETEG